MYFKFCLKKMERIWHKTRLNCGWCEKMHRILFYKYHTFILLEKNDSKKIWNGIIIDNKKKLRQLVCFHHAKKKTRKETSMWRSWNLLESDTLYQSYVYPFDFHDRILDDCPCMAMTTMSIRIVYFPNGHRTDKNNRLSFENEHKHMRHSLCNQWQPFGIWNTVVCSLL